jgi:hypothetical protein
VSTKRTWLWPLSWYFRIKHLEAEVAVLREMNRKLDAQMRAQAIAETAMTVAYMSALASMTADTQRWLAQR